VPTVEQSEYSRLNVIACPAKGRQITSAWGRIGKYR